MSTTAVENARGGMGSILHESGVTFRVGADRRVTFMGGKTDVAKGRIKEATGADRQR